MNQVENKIEQVEQKMINGVNVTKLVGTMDAIKNSPIISKFNFRAKGRWIDGGHNQTTINDFYGACQTHNRSQPFVYDEDEPPVLLGCLDYFDHMWQLAKPFNPNKLNEL